MLPLLVPQNAFVIIAIGLLYCWVNDFDDTSAKKQNSQGAHDCVSQQCDALIGFCALFQFNCLLRPMCQAMKGIEAAVYHRLSNDYWTH
jgi:uncharacterized membrane protein YuzA (DUF378 family)